MDVSRAATQRHFPMASPQSVLKATSSSVIGSQHCLLLPSPLPPCFLESSYSVLISTSSPIRRSPPSVNSVNLAYTTCFP